MAFKPIKSRLILVMVMNHNGFVLGYSLSMLLILLILVNNIFIISTVTTDQLKQNQQKLKEVLDERNEQIRFYIN